MVRRKTIRKRMRAKLRQLKQELQQRMHDPIAQTGRWLQSVVQGYSTTTRYQETSTASRCSENDCWDYGGADYVAGAKGIASRGTARLHWAADGYLNPDRSILIPWFALPPVIRDKNRMR